MPAQQELAEKFISENPSASVNEVAKAVGCSDRTVERARAKVKGEGISAKSNETTFKQDKDGAEYSFTTSKRIVSKEDLIEACDIDLSVWEVEKWVCNKWEVGMKLAATGGSKEGWKRSSDKVIVTPLFQVKLWLKPIHTEKQKSILEAIEDIVQSYSGGSLKKIKQTPIKSTKALKATLTDMHVGLDPNPNGRALYSYVYGEKQFNENLDKVFNSIMEERRLHGKFDILFVDDLGDGLDGWNGFTTRQGHKLDQNMDNREQFRVYVTGKLRLAESLINAEIANKIIFRSVTDDNHSGDFAFVANAAIQMMLERVYDKRYVEYVILKRFMEHFTYGDHTFILTHGKDAKNCFKGLPLELTEKAIKVIEDYIKRYKINTKYIHVEKGDLHQVAYEKNNQFDYRNFMSFAPPSSYVQNNHGDGYSGYSIQVIKKHGSLSHEDYYFDVEISEE
jgi:hypothetical protein